MHASEPFRLGRGRQTGATGCNEATIRSQDPIAWRESYTFLTEAYPWSEGKIFQYFSASL
jgi:hypothetical protein